MYFENPIPFCRPIWNFSEEFKEIMRKKSVIGLVINAY